MNADRTRALLGDPALGRLVDRVEQRMRRARPLDGPVTLAAVSDEERAAIARLLGRGIGSGSTVSIRLDELDRIVTASGAADGLADAVVVLRGPVPVDADEAARDRARWEAVLVPLDRFVAGRPEYSALVPHLRRTGLLKTVPGGVPAAERVVDDLVAVLTALPSPGETLAAFAARVLHSAHALDAGALRTLVDAALAPDAGDDVPAARWHSVGIAFDSLASSVLVHALPFATDGQVGAALSAMAATDQPFLVTLRMLLAGARPRADLVFVCENPAVLIAAADRFGSASPPIVCVRGQPSAAAQRLLRLLADAGTVLRYHGDFDWGGLRIANRVIERYGAVPWRYSVHDLVDLPGEALAGRPVDAVWDAALAPALQARGVRLEEEQVLETLLLDLAPLGPGSRSGQRTP